jgi:uncharacterized membrane protein
MHPYFWNNGYFGWDGFLWFGIVLLLSSLGYWRHTSAAHRRNRLRVPAQKDALDILSERYARGGITREQFAQQRRSNRYFR